MDGLANVLYYMIQTGDETEVRPRKYTKVLIANRYYKCNYIK